MEEPPEARRSARRARGLTGTASWQAHLAAFAVALSSASVSICQDAGTRSLLRVSSSACGPGYLNEGGELFVQQRGGVGVRVTPTGALLGSPGVERHTWAAAFWRRQTRTGAGVMAHSAALCASTVRTWSEISSTLRKRAAARLQDEKSSRQVEQQLALPRCSCSPDATLCDRLSSATSGCPAAQVSRRASGLAVVGGAAPVVVGQLVAVVVEPKHVQDLARRAGGDVRLVHRHIRLPQRVHQVCSPHGRHQASGGTGQTQRRPRTDMTHGGATQGVGREAAGGARACAWQQARWLMTAARRNRREDFVQRQWWAHRGGRRRDRRRRPAAGRGARGPWRRSASGAATGSRCWTGTAPPAAPSAAANAPASRASAPPAPKNSPGLRSRAMCHQVWRISAAASQQVGLFCSECLCGCV